MSFASFRAAAELPDRDDEPVVYCARCRRVPTRPMTLTVVSQDPSTMGVDTIDTVLCVRCAGDLCDWLEAGVPEP